MRAQGRVLVHCHGGVSRAPTIVLLHLIINQGLSLEEAWTHLKEARPYTNLNPSFWTLLEEFQAGLRTYGLRVSPRRAHASPPLKPAISQTLPKISCQRGMKSSLPLAGSPHRRRGSGRCGPGPVFRHKGWRSSSRAIQQPAQRRPRPCRPHCRQSERSCRRAGRPSGGRGRGSP
ncbi:MAG: dual specificity protein phosphatase [Candidatus Thiodiazotropha sp.]